MTTCSFSVPNEGELRQLLQASTEQGGVYQLAIVFASITKQVEGIQKVFQDFDIRVCGCSTAGEICEGRLESESITGLLIQLDEDAFTLWSGLAGSVSSQSHALGLEAVSTYTNPNLLVLSGGLRVDGEDIVNGIKEGAGRSLPAFGGMAADDYKLMQTYCFSDEHRIDNGIVAVIFDGNQVRLEGNAMSGWEPIGIENKITASKGNVIHEVNDMPALEFFNRFFDSIDNKAFRNDEVSIVSSLYPLQIVRPEGSFLRAPAMVHPNGKSVILAGGVKTGDRFRFSTTPGFQVLDDTVEYFRAEQEGASAPQGVLMISCKARHAAFGPLLEDEIEQIAQLYDAPFVGYLSYGEIAAIGDCETALHNDTCCVIRFIEVK